MVDTVIIHDPDQLHAVFAIAAASNHSLHVVTAEWAGIAYGVLYWLKAVEAARGREPEAPIEVVLHCGDDAARAMAAMREGWKHIVFSGGAALRGKIADIAAQQDASLHPEPADVALDLSDVADPATALEAWIAVRRRCK